MIPVLNKAGWREAHDDSYWCVFAGEINFVSVFPCDLPGINLLGRN